MPNNVVIQIEGLDLLERKIKEIEGLKDDLDEVQARAGNEISKEILNTEGLQRYPGETAANEPPEPYYIRGRGMQYKNYNDGRSENYGAQWTMMVDGPIIRIGNRASYSKYLGGDDQARAMERIGWRKIYDVAVEKLPVLKKIYQSWIDRLIKEKGLS